MALTRAQLLAGNDTQGDVLLNQVQGVTAGTGVTISNTGALSINTADPAFNAFIRTNAVGAYNSYIWPGAAGTTGQQLTRGVGDTLVWSDSDGIPWTTLGQLIVGTGVGTDILLNAGADGTVLRVNSLTPSGLEWVTGPTLPVTTVSGSSPTSPVEGQLWFDCDTGTFNVYQDCVGTPLPNWFNVAQPGLPVLPANTTSDVAWTGSGTQASPYLMTATSTGAGTAVQIINTVTITGLAPFQFVPIIDLNAVANSGRFNFTNNYADASGVLVFNTVFDDQPPSAPGASYAAAIKVGYGTVYIDATVAIVAPLSVTSGSINGTPAVGQVLTYTQGVASGGVPAASPPLYTLTQEWFVDGASTGQTGLNYTVASGDAGKSITVTITAQDSAAPPNTATATTTPVVIPVPTLSVTSGSIAGTPAVGQVLTYTQGVASGGLPPVVLTQEWFVNSVSTGQTGLNYTVQPGDAGKAITVTITATDSTSAQATATTSPFNIPGPLSIASAGTITGSTTSGSTLSYATGSASGGTGPYTYSWQWKRASDNAVLATDTPTYQLTAAEIGTQVYVTLTATDSVAATASGSTANYPASPSVITAGAFPNSSFTPAGAPNASPASVSVVGPPALNGTASCASWADGSPSLTSTGGIQFQVNGGGYGTGPTAVAPGNTVDVIWNPATIAGAADGATLTGTLTDGIFVNTYTITVTRAVTGLSFPDTTGNALSTPTTSSIITPGGFNVPVTLTFAGTTGNALTAIGVAVGGVGGFLGSPRTVNPGQTLQIQGTTGPTVNTDYGVDLTMGSGPAATDTWLAKTTTGAPEITPPNIVTPSGGATGVGTPTGITITADPYVNLGGAGSPQTSSKWEVYKNSYPLTSTNAITGVTQSSTGIWSSVGTLPGWTNTVTSVSYGNGTWLASGGTGLYSASTDEEATTWSNTATIPGWVASNGASTSTFGNGIFVQVQGRTGAQNRGFDAAVSSDGVTWSAPVTVAATGGAPGGEMVFGGGTFMVIGSRWISTQPTTYHKLISTSADGVNWNTITALPGWTSQQPRCNGYGNGVWVIAGVNFTNGTSTTIGASFSRSTDGGSTWSTRASLPGWTNSNPDIVVYGNGRWVAIDPVTLDYTTSTNDGVTWSTKATLSVPGWTLGGAASINYVNGLWILTGLNGQYSISYDGITWETTQTISGWSAQFNDINYNGTIWVAVGASGQYATSYAPNGSTTLAIAGCQADGFLVGDSVVSVPAAAGPATITAVSNTTVTVAPPSTSWAIGQQISRATSSYTAVTGSPFNKTTGTLTSLDIAKPPLEANTKYWVRAQYATTNFTATTSNFGNWSSFTTGTLIPTIGALYGGGYFAGQILGSGSTSGVGGLDNAGTIYNIVVAPVEGDPTGPVVGGSLRGQNGGATPTGITYRTPDGANGNTNAQNLNFGGLCTSEVLAGSATGGASAYPVFNTFINGATGPNAGAFNLTTGGAGGGTGIGGYNDWYLPAKNELEVLYYYLKPDTTSNSTTSGSNANAVPPEPVSTNYTASAPARTTVTLFQTGGGQDFSNAAGSGNNYWCSTENSASTTAAWRQTFVNGNQTTIGKNTSCLARACRRVLA